MALLSLNPINTRSDLDALAGTPRHAEFIALLKGSMVRRQDAAVYPEGYGQTGYDGPVVSPVWVDVEDLGTIETFGFTKAEIEALP